MTLIYLLGLNAFFLKRTQFVSAKNSISSTCFVTSGVPQGSFLRPLLFLTYINDLLDKLTSSVHPYADDCVIYHEITNPDDTFLLQSDLNTIYSWCNQWLMNLIVSKCKMMKFSSCSAVSTSSYKINNSIQSSFTSYKYLGVHITNNLSWQTHIEYVTNSVNRTLGF